MSARPSTRPRIKIRVPKKAATLDLPTTWSTLLGPAVDQILNQNKSQLSFEVLYDATYRIVLQHHGKALYKRFGEEIKSYLSSQMLTAILNVEQDLVQTVACQWGDYISGLRMISDIFMYLNRAYCDANNVPRVEQVGELSFRDEILRASSAEISTKLYARIQNEVNKARRGEVIDRTHIRSVIEMLSSLPAGGLGVSDSLYVVELEPLLVQSSSKFYRSLSDDLLSASAPAIDLLRSMQQWLATEESYSDVYLPQSTATSIVGMLEAKNIGQVITEALNSSSGFLQWLENDDLEALQVSAALEVRSGAQDSLLISKLGEVLRDRQISLNKLVEDAKAGSDASGHAARAGVGAGSGSGPRRPLEVATSWVQSSIKLQQKFRNISAAISNAYKDPRAFENTLSAIWADAINRMPKVAEFLTLYLDDLLKKSARPSSEADLESRLNETLLVFEAIAEKDRFANHYSLHLARRLLNNRSQSEDLERSFISRLRQKAGHSATTHFDGMFKDMRLSKDLNSGFKQRAPTVPTKVNVLTLTMWPTFCTSDKSAILPPSLEAARQEFESFYLDKHNSRKLKWNLSIGSADVEMNVDSGTYMVTLALYGVAIMNLFSGDDRYSTVEIERLSGVPLADAKRQLKGLVVSRLLIKEPASGDVEDQDVFSFNKGFKSSKRNIKVTTSAASARSEITKQDKESQEDVEKTRGFRIDAAIVRVMKSRQRLEHSELLEAVSAQVSRLFKPSVSLIKHRIAYLMETEYLARDEANPSVYLYLG